MKRTVTLTTLQRETLALGLNLSRERILIIMPEMSEKQIENIINRLFPEEER